MMKSEMKNHIAKQTVPEFVSNYFYLEELACNGRLGAETLEEYNAYKSTVNDIDTAVMFLENNTCANFDMTKFDFDGGKTVAEYDKAMEMYSALTCDGNKEFREFLDAEAMPDMQTVDIGDHKSLYLPDYESDRELTQSIVAAKGNEYLLVSRNEDALSSLDDYSMGNMLEAIDETKQIMKDLEVEDPRQAVIGFLPEEKIYIIEQKEIDEVEKRIIKEQEEPAEVIESNDGFVMNTSKQTSANISAINRQTTAQGEVVHNEAPRETTNDVTAAKGNVKLETVRDIGSKEKSEIDSGNGVDSDIEKLAKSSPEYYKQTDIQPKKRVVDDFER